MRLRGLGLGRVGIEKLKNSHKGGVVQKFRTREGVVRISHKAMCCANFSHKALFTHPNAKLWCFQMGKILGF